MLGASKFSTDKQTVKKSLLGGLLIVESFQCDSAADEVQSPNLNAPISEENSKPNHLSLVDDLQKQLATSQVHNELENFMRAQSSPAHSDHSRADENSLPTKNRNNPDGGNNKEAKAGPEKIQIQSPSSEDLYARDKKSGLNAPLTQEDLYARKANEKASLGNNQRAEAETKTQPARNSLEQQNLRKDKAPDESLTELMRAAPAKTSIKESLSNEAIVEPKLNFDKSSKPSSESQNSDAFSFVDELPSQDKTYLNVETQNHYEAPASQESSSSIRGLAKWGPFTLSNIWGRKSKNVAATKKMVKVPTQEELNFFFRATDDELLYNLGDSFYRDFKNGMKHFGFAHVNSHESQQRSILGIASFIKYFEDNRILVITDKMDGSFFSAFKRESTRKTMDITGLPGFSYNVYKAYALNYLEMDELAIRAKSSKVKVLPTIIKNLMADYDVVLIDLPPHKARRDHYDLYLPLLQTINHVTLTVSLKKSLFSEVNELRQYFASYKIKIKGSVVEKSPTSPRPRNLDRRPSV
jgi:hypothetical protein